MRQDKGLWSVDTGSTLTWKFTLITLTMCHSLEVHGILVHSIIPCGTNRLSGTFNPVLCSRMSVLLQPVIHRSKYFGVIVIV